MSRLLAAISAHGFGHLAQSAAVLNELHRRYPKLERVIRTGLPEAVVRRRIGGDFLFQAAADDFGMVQVSALAVDVAASAERYAIFHTDWSQRVESVARELEAAAPDLVLADIPYLTLAGAARAGIPALAICCLNWADIYRHFCSGRPEANRILGQMESAYGTARSFLRTDPSMPMAWLDNAVDIGPVMATGRNRRAELDARWGLAGERLVVVAVGGIHLRLPIERWPVLPGVRWIVQREWGVLRDDILELESLDITFADLLTSADLLFTKPGYGSFTEAAGNGLPVLYVPRDDWPESPYLEHWLDRFGRSARVDAVRVEEGEFAGDLMALLEAGRHRPVSPSGVADAVDRIAGLLSLD